MFQTFVAILHRKCDLRRKIMPENVIMLRFFLLKFLHIFRKSCHYTLYTIFKILSIM